jgi:hypothetical protein
MQMPNSNPLYMAQGGLPYQNPMYMAEGGQVASPDKMGLASMIRTGATPDARMAALRQMRGEGPGGFSGKGQMGQAGQQQASPLSFFRDFFMRMGKGQNQQAAIGKRLDESFSSKFPNFMSRQG